MKSVTVEVWVWVKLVIQTGYFCLRYRPWLRQLMFYLTLATVGQLFIGAVLLDRISRSFWVFILFWGFCVLLVLLMMLLALYDILAIRVEQRNELKRLREDIFGDQDRS